MADTEAPQSEKETAPNQDRENAQEAASEVLQGEAKKAVLEQNSNDYLQAALESNEAEGGGAEAVADVGIDASL